MASMNYVPGVGFVRNIPGTDRTVVMGSAEDRAFKEQADKRREKLFSHQFDYGKDYRDLYGKLFNADNRGTDDIGGFSTGGYNQGGWSSDLSKRLENISNQGVDFMEKAGSMYGFAEKNRIGSHGSDIFDRNNAIMDMYRRGYDKDQIRGHLSGKINLLKEEPSWRDYYKDKQEAGEGVNWTDGFFIGAPDQDYGGYVGQRLSTALDTMADRFNKFFGNTAFGIDDTPIPQPTPDVFPEQEDRPVTRGLFGKYINKGQEQ